MVLIFLFLFCHQTIRVAVLLDLEQYQVAELGVALVFPVFLTSPNNKSRLVIRH